MINNITLIQNESWFGKCKQSSYTTKWPIEISGKLLKSNSLLN